VKAFAYLRVSGRSQVDGDGFDRQLLACQKYAADNDYEIAEVFREEAVSGTKELDDRPALAALLVALEENGIKTVLIEKLDRLARDLMVQETIIADFQRRGFTLISVYEPDLCSDDPSRKLMRQIMGAIAEYDRVMIVQKLRAARGRKKLKHGKGEGRHAFGEKASEAITLKEILGWRAAGATPKHIAEALNNGGYKSRSGKPWLGTTVAKILRRVEAEDDAAYTRRGTAA
jgi:DNA invertase Pin-like site-specific DNA recombinase